MIMKQCRQGRWSVRLLCIQQELVIRIFNSAYVNLQGAVKVQTQNATSPQLHALYGTLILIVGVVLFQYKYPVY